MLILLLACGCGRFGFDARGAPDAQDPQDADGTSTRLVVTRSDDRMAGPPTMSSMADLTPGSVGLSLREALTIANHRPGPDVVELDAAALPASTILISAALVVGGSGTQIDASGGVAVGPATGYTGALIQVNGAEAVIDGLTLRGGTFGIQALAVAGITVRNATFLDTTDHAIQLDSCSQVVVEDNRIERAGRDSLHLYGTSEALVQRNFVALPAKTGAVHGFWLEEVHRSRILDNIIDPGEAHLIRLTNSSDNEIIGNVLDRGESGLVLYGNSSGNLIFRNVVISPTYDTVYIEGASNKVINNTFYQGPDVVDRGTGTMAVNNLLSTATTDFVAPAPPAYNFHLIAGHAAIDTGTDLGLDMLPSQPARFLGSQPDTGAVESY
jgi:parallel beta-helix repeat protein